MIVFEWYRAILALTGGGTSHQGYVRYLSSLCLCRHHVSTQGFKLCLDIQATQVVCGPVVDTTRVQAQSTEHGHTPS